VPRILVSGTSGLIGAALVHALTAKESGGDGDDAGGSTRVIRLTRRPSAAGEDTVTWDPERGMVDTAMLERERIDAVVHLSGAPIARRWTRSRKREILVSRVDSTALLAHAVAALPEPPTTFISASAVGYYGDRGEALVDETSPPGTGFLAGVCQAWEAAAAPAEAAGIRVVHPRFGVVLSRGGGMLGSLLPVFRLGVGGRLGSGRQWLSWIAIDDAVGALRFLLEHESLHGAVNVTAPAAATNATFTATLGRVLRRPAIATVPARVLRWMLGAMADETLLTGQRVYPRILEAAGYPYRHPVLEEALRATLESVGPGALRS
jgi:uncharacterized protein